MSTTDQIYNAPFMNEPDDRVIFDFTRISQLPCIVIAMCFGIATHLVRTIMHKNMIAEVFTPYEDIKTGHG